MRNHVPRWEIVVRRGRIAMSRRHDKRSFSRRTLAHWFRGTLVAPRGRLDRARQCRILDYLPELADIVTRIVAIYIPDLQELVEPFVMFRVLLSVIRRGEADQIDDVQLRRSAQGGKGHRRVQVVAGVVEQIVQEIEDMEPLPLGRGLLSRLRILLERPRQGD
jgi:hypothetical protein